MRAVAFVLFLVLAPVAPTASLGAAATATDGPDATAPPTTSVSDSAADRRVRFGGEPRPEKLSESVRLRMQGSDGKVPVLLVFRRQPDETFDLSRLEWAEARQRMQALAEDTQANVLGYLERQRQRGRASDVRSLWLRNVVAVEATPAVIEELSRSRQIERIVPDRRVSLNGEASEDGIGSLIEGLGAYGNTTVSPDGLERETSGLSEWNVEYVGADDVQDAGVTGEGVNVSVVDTGIDEDHPAIPQVTKWRDFVNTSNGEPVDLDGHGTHVAGTVAGQRDAKYAVGVAPGVNLYGARVLDANGSGNTSDVIAGFQWSANESADVVSASLGTGPVPDARNASLTLSNGSSGNASFQVYRTANGSISGDDLHGFRPAYTFVIVEPVAYNGSSIAEGSETQARVEENISLALRNPQGDRNLTGIPAGWWFQSGEVPDGVKILKYKPSTVRELRNGSWNLTVENGNAENVSVEVETAPVYVANGTDEGARAADNLAAQGVVPVVSAGNAGVFGNQSIGSPGSADGAITVGATGYQVNDVARFSSRGPVGFDSPRPGVDVIAPGTSVTSALSTDAYVGEEPYGALSGTSMAAPHVSGTAALVLSQNPGTNVSEVESTLEDNAQSVPGGENAVGVGALDAWTAVNSTTNLGTPGGERGVRDLWAGIGNTGDDYVSVRPQPPSDTVGDAGTAPDIERAYASSLPEFQFGFDDAASPNGSVVVYVDADRNRSTGASITDPQGADFRFNASRTHDPANDSYTLAVTSFAYNESQAQFVPTVDYASDERADGDFVGFDLGIDTDRFDWYAVSRDASTGETDRVPDDTTATLSSTRTDTVSGVAVAWNSTAGGPAADEPIEFRLYDRSDGTLLDDATVRTNASGVARTEFTVGSVGDNADFTLEVEDTRNDRVSQSYDVYIDDLTDEYYPQEFGVPYRVGYENYVAESNGTVSLNVPVFRVEGEGFAKYSGPASIRLRNSDAPAGNDTVDIDGLNVSDGVIRTTIDFAGYGTDDYGAQPEVDFEVALESDFANATRSEFAGDVRFGAGFYRTDLGPGATTVAPGSRANLTFQNTLVGPTSASRSREPANVTTDYRVTWVTDRQVAAIYRDLSPSVANSLRQARESGSPLEPEEYRELEEAIENVSDAGVTPNATSGQVDPVRRGVGALGVTPPSDARFGFVSARVNASAAGNGSVPAGFSTVFVEDGLSPYLRDPTSPAEEDRYELYIDADWDEHREGDYFVPNGTISVDVFLYDSRNETLVDGANVSLYTSGGDTTTVVTDGSGGATTSLPAPDVDYRNRTSFSFQQQEILGVAQGYSEPDGSAEADEEFVYGTVFRVGGSDETVRSDPELSWSNGSLDLGVRYRNESYAPTNGTETLVELATPDYSESRRDLLVGFVDPNNATTLNRSFDEPVPTDAQQQWSVRTRTPDSITTADPYGGFGSAFAGGPRVTVASPSTLQPNATQAVTLNVTDRNGQPIPDAVVRFSWTDAGIGGTEGGSSFAEASGESFFGTTDANGQVSFRVTPDTAEDLVAYEVGLATTNFSAGLYRSGSLEVGAERANVTGRIVDHTDTVVPNDLVIVENGDKQNLTTDANGRFEFTGAPDTYAFAYIQGNRSSTTDDEIPDLRPLGTRDVSGDTDLGTFQLPQAYDVDFEVVNESGAPVENATVVAYQENRTGSGLSVAALARVTDANGQVPADGGRGFDLEGNVSLAVIPPDTGEFADETYVRNVTVASDRNETFQLRELGTGDLEVSPDEVYANVTTAEFALRNATYDAAPDTYAWDFGDGTIINTSSNTTSHVYTGAGEYTATVNVFNNSTGRLLTAETTVTVAQAGTANLTATPTTADVNVTDVSLAIDPRVDANVTVANYSYTFGDGTGVTTDSATRSVNHTYSRIVGEVTVRVTATNATGTVLFTDAVNVTVTDTVAPVARLDAPDSVPQNAEFTVDASNSTDNHRVGNYTFETDAGYSNTSESPTRTLSFGDPGNHTVTVTVTDALGNQNSTNVTVEVLERPDISVDVSTASTQRLQDGVNATVNITNVGGNDVDSSFAVNITSSNNPTVNRTYTVGGLNASESDVRTVDLTAWAQSNGVTGDLTFNASVDPVTDEANTDDNADEARTTVTYSDLRVRLAVPTRAAEGENVTAYLLFSNAGTAPSDATTATLAVNGTTDTYDVPALDPGEVSRTSRTDTVRTNRTYELAVDDPLFPAGNATSQSLTVFQYDLTAPGLTAPSEVELDDAVLVIGEFDANAAGDVDASLETSPNLSVRGAANKTVYGQAGTNTVRWRVTGAGNATQENVTLNATFSRLDQSGAASADSEIVVPKVRLTDDASIRLDESENSSNATLGNLSDATTFDQNLTVDVQAGARGRALKGLEYLFDYPRGCVEQTVSPMLAALNADQYYRNRTVSYDRQRVNDSVEQGVDRLAPNGSTEANAQHDNGSWSMWGNDPRGDLFYTVYALYGTTAVDRDPVQAPANSAQLDELDYGSSVDWLAGKQNADGSFASNHYYDDRRSMTGLGLVAADRADDAGVSGKSSNLTRLRQNATAYLTTTQNADGSWNGSGGSSSAMATALAVRGLATVVDSGALNASQQSAAEAALADGVAWLEANQRDDGSWSPYHQSRWWNPQGDISETTGQALLALDSANATGVPVDNATLDSGVGYLTDVYRSDGSFGYTRATAVAIDALQRLSTSSGTRTVTVQLVDGDGSVLLDETATVSGDDPIESVTLTDEANATELQSLRAAGELEVEVTSSDSRVVIVGVSNDQVVDEREHTSGGD